MHKLIFGLINLLLFNHSNMFRPLNRSHHQGVQNPWELQAIVVICYNVVMCMYSRRDVIAVECSAFHSNHIKDFELPDDGFD